MRKVVVVCNWLLGGSAILFITITTVVAGWYIFLGKLVLKIKEVTPVNQVKVISWWGYLGDKSKIAELERQCDASIALTEYVDMDIFSDLIKNNPYDIYIYFPGDRYNQVQAVTQSGPDISVMATDYAVGIKEHYFAANLDTDTVLFQLDTSVPVYSARFFPDIEHTPLADIFQIAENRGGVVLQKGFEQLYGLFERDNPAMVDHYWDWLYQLVIQRRIVLSAFATDYQGESLVFGYLDGGEAHTLAQGKSMAEKERGVVDEFQINVSPKYSTVSVDLLALKSHKQAAQCVAQTMAGRKFLDWVTQTSYYFSPYGDVPRNDLQEPLSPVAEDFQRNVAQLSWLSIKPRPEGYYSDHARNTWDKIMVCLRNKNQDCRALVAGY